MNILLFPNPTRKDAVSFAEILRHEISMNGSVCTDCREGLDPSCGDMCIVVGGDGTVLKAVRWLAGENCSHIPIWAVNCGHLGYLTDCEREGAVSLLPRVLNGEYQTEKRIMLSGKFISGGETSCFFALNEIVIHRSGFARSLKISLMVDGKGILEFTGDGLLISTPTGSTAYNLSAGGPLLLPSSRLMVITPICAHSPLCAPLVVPGESRISITTQLQEDEGEGDMPQIVVDGCQHMAFSSGDRVLCSQSSKVARFVKTDDTSFYSKLSTKFLKST